MSAKKVHSNTTRLANATLGLGLAVSLSATATIATAEPTPSSQPTATATATPQTTQKQTAPAKGTQARVTPRSIVAKGATSVQMRVTTPRGWVVDVNSGHRDNRGSWLVNQSKFRAGSVTKLVTSAAVMKLVERGKLSLDDPIDTHLPGVYTFGKKVTVRHLLHQTSGLPTSAYEQHLPYDKEESTTRVGMQKFLRQHYTDKQMVGFINKTGLKHTPGTTWEYSNANFVIAGQIIGAVSGDHYSRFIERTIFTPLKMRNSSLPDRQTSMRWPYAKGYLPSDFYGQKNQQPIELTRQSGSMFGAAGSLVTTTGDLNTFLDALYEGRVVSRKSLAHMKQVGVANPANYGLGMMQLKTPCGTARGHNGNVYGYTTIALNLNGTSVSIGVAEGKAAYAAHSLDAQKLALKTLCPTMTFPEKKG